LLAAGAALLAAGDLAAGDLARQFESMRLAVDDLTASFPEQYQNGSEYLRRLAELQQKADDGQDVADAFRRLRNEALLANPLLGFDELIVLKRKRGQLGLPTNHQGNSCLKQKGYDNEIAVLSPVRPGGTLRTLYRPEETEFVGEIDLHFDADRLLFTMPNGRTWQIHEIGTDGLGLRQVSREIADVDNFDACYLPDGRIVFASTASYTAVPCWHGKERACSLFLMNADGSGVRQLGFDQDLTLHPAVLPDGQVIYSRWDYAGPLHMYLRPLMVMNPDGTGQRAVYGSGSYWPNSLFFPRGIPGAPGKVVAVVSGYHGVNRMGLLALLDLRRGWHEADGVVQLIPDRQRVIDPIIRDHLVDHEWPKFLHPYPLSEKYFLAAGRPGAESPWGIYLLDVFGNMLPVLVDPESDFFEPIPVQPQPKPSVLPDRVDLTRDDAVVYLHDVYAGPGLAGVPRGTVRRLRVAAYHFGYPGLAGPDKIGCGGPWEVMRILGTVPVHDDGSAAFRVPAQTPLTIQALDADGQAVQLMRSWFTAMPGEVVSCVGCHETSRETPAVRYEAASVGLPPPIEPWYGPPRGFSFEREVQPVLDRYCVGCHDGRPEYAGSPLPDLRGLDEVEHYGGRPLTRLATQRLHPATVAHLGGNAVLYTPAYEALLPYVRRVGIEDDVHMLVPGEYHAGTSPLVQMLRKGHHGVRLDAEAWDRLVTWIDLNAPCHGTWGEVAPVPEGADRRRWELQRLHGGPADDFEQIPEIARHPVERIVPDPPPPPPPMPELAGWPFDAAEAQRRQAAGGKTEKTVDLGGGVTLQLVRIPAGRFVMSSTDGHTDEQPPAVVTVPRDFWMGAFEVTNEQFGRFDPGHRTGYFMQRYSGMDGPGMPLDAPRQPVIRVSWQQAMAFCRWLSEQTGMHFTLPTEAQWEYACRAGTASALSYGTVDADFSRFANMADLALSRRPPATGGLESSFTTPFIQGIILEAAIGGDMPCDVRYDDGAVATAEAGSYAPNAWGVYDMHGNAAEWTRSAWRPYPYDGDDGRNAPDAAGPRVVRGGSFVDRPARCRSAFRLGYPAWQRVHNVGFRVVVAVGPPCFQETCP
jgi:formylglycine-generating enzyme required for sulfatase activity